MNRLALALVALAILPGCPSLGTDGAPNWPMIATELELGAADLRDVASLLDDQPTADALRDLAGVLEMVGAQLGEGGGPANAIETIQAALALADQLVERLPEGAQDEARAVILIVRAGLRRALAYGGGQ